MNAASQFVGDLIKAAGLTDWYELPGLRSSNSAPPSAAERAASKPKPAVQAQQNMYSEQNRRLNAEGVADRLRDVESQAMVDREMPAPRPVPGPYVKPEINRPVAKHTAGSRPTSLPQPSATHATASNVTSGPSEATQTVQALLSGGKTPASPAGAATAMPPLSSAASPPTGMPQVSAPDGASAGGGGWDTMNGMYDSWNNLSPEMRGGIGVGAAGLGLYGLSRLLSRKRQPREEESTPQQQLMLPQPQMPLMLPGPSQPQRMMMMG